MKQKIELNPCPFCGGKAVIRMVGDHKQYFDIVETDVQPVKSGQWIYGEFDIPYCSECKKEVMPNMVSKFCPNCGARMYGKDDE